MHVNKTPVCNQLVIENAEFLSVELSHRCRELRIRIRHFRRFLTSKVRSMTFKVKMGGPSKIGGL